MKGEQGLRAVLLMLPDLAHISSAVARDTGRADCEGKQIREHQDADPCCPSSKADCNFAQRIPLLGGLNLHNGNHWYIV